MPRELLIAVIAGLIAMFGWGFADFFAKKTIDRIGSVPSLVWAHLFGTLALLIFILYQIIIAGQLRAYLPAEINIWGGLLFFGALQAIVYLLAYEGFGKGQLAVLNPVFASYSGLAVVISIIIFKEKSNLHLLLALAAIFTGVLLLNIDTKALKLKSFRIGTPGFNYVALAALLAAFWQVFWDKFIHNQNWIFNTLLMYIFMTLTAFIVARLQRINLHVPKKGPWILLVLIGLCEVTAYLALSLGFSVTSFTSIVIILAGAFSLPTIILARTFLKEKVTPLQTIATFVIIAGVIFLSIR